jgi:hypothetical protein
MRWVGHVELMRKAQSFIIKPKGKRPLPRPRRRWEDNIRNYTKEAGWSNMNWAYLA